MTALGIEKEKGIADNDTSSGNGEEEETLLEPRFKYLRILYDVASVLKQDIATCMAVHEKFIAIGTKKGFIRVFDHLGNLGSGSSSQPHRCAITMMVVDQSGNYLASCASDARINIRSIGSTEFNQTLDLKSVVHSIAMSPDFAKRNSGQSFVTGDRNLVLHERKLIINYRSMFLYQGFDRDGDILQISWRESYILFTNNTGSRVYDRSHDRIIALIPPTHKDVLRNSLKTPPSHCWMTSTNFAIGWANTVCICAIVSASGSQRGSSALAEKKVEVHYNWELDMYIANISFTVKDPLSNIWSEIAVFGVKKSLSHESKEEMDIVLSLLEPCDLESYVLTTEDRIEMRNCDSSNLRTFHMCALPYESIYFLLGPKDLIEARPFSADDKVRWYVENELLEEAMMYANEHKGELVTTSAVDIGKEYVNLLMEQKKFSQAAKLIAIVCEKKKEQWEFYVNEFERRNVVLQLAKFLPTRDPQLEPESYQSVLVAALYNHPVLFYRLIKAWNPDIYRAGAITDMAMKRVMHDRLTEDDSGAICRALASLYTYERKYEQALRLYLSMNDKSIFGLIDRYHLFEMVKNQVTKLMHIDSILAIRLLMDNAGSLPAKDILSQLANFPKFQLAYLNKLFERNEGDVFADLAVRLYAEHEPQKLLPFLRGCECYDMTKALEMCEKKELNNEMVFLLGRSGDLKRALNLLVEKLDRIDLAIDFCRETNDEDLWEALIDSSMSKPERITKLLNNAGNYIDPLTIIQKIPCDMDIPDLRNSLVKILRDYEVQVEVQNGCKLVALEDCGGLFSKYVRSRNRPIEVKESSRCVICGKVMLFEQSPSNVRPSGDITAFGCKHFIHNMCVTLPENLSRKRFLRLDKTMCPICSGGEFIGAKFSRVM